MKKQIMYLMLTALLLGTIVPSVFADAALTNERFNATGNYEIVASGVGLDETGVGVISITVPGTVVQAYLYWAGFDFGDGDNKTIVQFNGDPAEELLADQTYGPDTWRDGEYSEFDDHYVYWENITSDIDPGLNAIAISDIVMDRVYGAGIIVVYEDVSLPMAEVTILDGLDSFFVEFDADGDVRGPNSEVTSIMFDSASVERTAELTMIVGGTEHDNRPNEVWTATGDGAVLTDLVDVGDPSGVVSGYPLFASDGGAWDTYTKDLTVNADDTWLGIQIESFSTDEYVPPTNDDNGLGNSGVIVAVAAVLPLPEPCMGGKVTGGGQIPIGTGKKETATFGFNAIGGSKQPGLKGELQYLDHTTGMLVHAHTIDSLIVWENLPENKPWPLRYAKFSGSCTVDHEEGYRFEVTVEDNGEPGKDDCFSIKIYEGSSTDPFYEKGGCPIIKGNIQIHKP